MLNFDEGLLIKSQEETLFYSPELKRMTLSRQFKRPQKVLKQENGICPRCFRPSIITIDNSSNRPYMDIKRSQCEKGHVEIVKETRIDWDKSKSSYV